MRFPLDQARAALWLLCRFGGVGAKCRKGFGSFADPPELADLDLAACQAAAAAFRAACGVGKDPNPAQAESASIIQRR